MHLIILNNYPINNIEAIGITEVIDVLILLISTSLKCVI